MFVAVSPAPGTLAANRRPLNAGRQMTSDDLSDEVDECIGGNFRPRQRWVQMTRSTSDCSVTLGR